MLKTKWATGFWCGLMALCCSSISNAAPVDCAGEGNITVVQYGDSVTCTSESQGDIDTFHFVGSAGDTIHFSIYGPGGGDGRWQAELYDPDSVLLDSASASASPELDANLTKDGTHTVLVISTSALPSYPHEFTLEVPCLLGDCIGEIPEGTLGYTAVDPCRIVDTRYGIGGSMSAGETRDFKTYGDISSQTKLGGGAPANYPDECPFALGEHSAVHLNVTVVPRGPDGQGGYVTVWPQGETQPETSFMNFRAGLQNMANAGTVRTNNSDAATPDISVFSLRDIDLVIDVMGYYTD